MTKNIIFKDFYFRGFSSAPPKGRSKVTNYYGTLVLEQPKHQVYWISALDSHEHGQMNENEVIDCVDQLETSGFEK